MEQLRCLFCKTHLICNRFISLPGYFDSAHEAGRHTFTFDSEYLWYGMLLRKLP